MTYMRLALIGASVLAFGAYSAWVYHKGMAHVQAEWDQANAQAVLEGHKDQLEIGKIDLGLQEKLDENRDNQPVIAVVPELVCPGASVPAAAGHSRAPARSDGEPTTAAIGAALKADADRYANCWATLTAAQAALRICQGSWP